MKKKKLKIGYKINHHSSIMLNQEVTEKQADDFLYWYNKFLYSQIVNKLLEYEKVNKAINKTDT